MDDDPFSGWGLRPVELTDRDVLTPYFTSLSEPLSDYTFSQLFTWRNSLRILWKQIGRAPVRVRQRHRRPDAAAAARRGHRRRPRLGGGVRADGRLQRPARRAAQVARRVRQRGTARPLRPRAARCRADGLRLRLRRQPHDRFAGRRLGQQAAGEEPLPAQLRSTAWSRIPPPGTWRTAGSCWSSGSRTRTPATPTAPAKPASTPAGPNASRKPPPPTFAWSPPSRWGSRGWSYMSKTAPQRVRDKNGRPRRRAGRQPGWLFPRGATGPVARLYVR